MKKFSAEDEENSNMTFHEDIFKGSKLVHNILLLTLRGQTLHCFTAKVGGWDDSNLSSYEHLKI